jgi:hypothetical protein
MAPYRMISIGLLLLAGNGLMAQDNEPVAGTASLSQRSSLKNKPPKDTLVFSRKGCKHFFFLVKPSDIPEPVAARQVQQPQPEKKPFIVVHGNILYNFSYRSYVDTPFAESNLAQHLIQTRLSFVLANRYPVNMTITHRNSNSPYFRDATDVNFGYNRRQLVDRLKVNLRSQVDEQLKAGIGKLQSMQDQYKSKLNQVQDLRSWLSSPARMQEMIEEKEKQLGKQLIAAGLTSTGLDSSKELKDIRSLSGRLPGGLPGNPRGLPDQVWSGIRQGMYAEGKEKLNTIKDSASGLLKDTLQSLVRSKTGGADSTVSEKIQAKKQELAKLQSEVKQQEAKIRKEKQFVTDSVSKIKREISDLDNGPGIYAFMKRHNIGKDKLTRAERILLAINKISIGRAWIDYSELTVKNVSLTGVNIEVTPSPLYFAAAAGKLNYRFRDFIIKNNRELPNQSLYLIRAGVGQKEKNNLIFTFYSGKKEVLNSTPSNSPSSLQRVLGYSAEARFALDKNNYLVAEFAKSSYGNTGARPSDESALGKAMNWKIRTNEAYSVQLFSQYPQTDSRLTAYYRKMGERFQSFNLYPTGNNQEAWMVKLNQGFWKRKLVLDAAIRKNDFASPIAAPSSFSSKTIFKSFQATLRIPKYPFVSVGYYPTSQLSMSNNNILTENQYNTLNAIVSHSYHVKHLAMNTNAVYTKFYNSGADSGFVYYNASNWMINHSFFFSGLTWQTSAGLTQQRNLHLFSLEELLSYQFPNRITLSGSLKWNRLNRTENLFGGTATLSMYIRKLGSFQFHYDKTYLPAYNSVLRPVDIGRMSFYREF